MYRNLGAVHMDGPGQDPEAFHANKRHADGGEVDHKGAVNLGVNLVKASIEGVISSTAQAYRGGLRVITPENRAELSNVRQWAAPTVNNGVVVTLDGTSAWTVTGTSYITMAIPGLALTLRCKPQHADIRTGFRGNGCIRRSVNPPAAQWDAVWYGVRRLEEMDGKKGCGIWISDADGGLSCPCGSAKPALGVPGVCHQWLYDEYRYAADHLGGDRVRRDTGRRVFGDYGFWQCREFFDAPGHFFFRESAGHEPGCGKNALFCGSCICDRNNPST